jgi:CRISPR/Cas system CMR-associated protein Cmr1 (group 7 of RAMP superfamily)
MLYREIMTVCSEMHTKHINTVCGQNVELLNVKLAAHIVRTWVQWVESRGQREFKIMTDTFIAITNVPSCFCMILYVLREGKCWLSLR